MRKKYTFLSLINGFSEGILDKKETGAYYLLGT